MPVVAAVAVAVSTAFKPTDRTASPDPTPSTTPGRRMAPTDGPYDHHVHTVAPSTEADDGTKGLAVLFCDLDGFKSINDRFGHHTGDAVLIEVARRLTTGVRDGDTVARLGGDEFVVLADGLGAADAADLAVRLRNAIIPPIRVDGRAVRVGASFGIGWASCGMSADEVLRSADQRMYIEKRSRSKAHRRAGFEAVRRPWAHVFGVGSRGSKGVTCDDDAREQRPARWGEQARGRRSVRLPLRGWPGGRSHPALVGRWIRLSRGVGRMVTPELSPASPVPRTTRSGRSVTGATAVSADPSRTSRALRSSLRTPSTRPRKPSRRAATAFRSSRSPTPR